MVFYSFAVKPMPRRLGAGGFISSRMAERIAAMAWFVFKELFVEPGFKLRKLPGELFVRGE